MVDIANPNARSSGSEGGSGSDQDSPHRRMLKIVKSIEKRLKRMGVLKLYEVFGSYLDHIKGDLIRERSVMPTDCDLAMPKAEDQAHFPHYGYHTFYTDQLDMGHRFSVTQTIQKICKYYGIFPNQPNFFGAPTPLFYPLKSFLNISV